MPEQREQPSQSLSHAQALRQEAGRRLSRSPHPYHKQQFELPYSSERVSSKVSSTSSPLWSAQTTDDEEQESPRGLLEDYREGLNSESGTEADDEHFLKGLPAPKLRPHKGLRGGEGSLSSSPSPRLSPEIFDRNNTSAQRTLRRSLAAIAALNEEEARDVAARTTQKRKVEVVRRITEAGILVFVGGIICRNDGVRELLWIWKREISCQSAIIGVLISLYPLRLIYHINPIQPWKRPLPIGVPVVFDPAPLFYPPVITMLVSMLVLPGNPTGLLASIILSIASLPKELIPAVGGLQGANTTQWFISCLPLLVSSHKSHVASLHETNNISPEILVLLPPLHQALCVTLHYLTTTSLLPAELQLLSVGLIDLLLLASSPQAVILKSLLWGGGVGVLITCTQVLKWGVALARVPKWRFRHAGYSKQKGLRSTISFGKALLGRDTAIINSSEDDDDDILIDVSSRRRTIPSLKLAIKENINHALNSLVESGSLSAIDTPTNDFSLSNGSIKDSVENTSGQRRHTISTPQLPEPSKTTPSGRKKRSASSSVRSFFHLTQSQATWRKWLYAAYVYTWVLVLILVGIREYVQRYALQGNEPVGWALGYLFGDNPWFRMEIVTQNLQRWICLPPRSSIDHTESCHQGWVEHLRHASFGGANTRLILCGYWLAIIVVGLAVVFRLSAVYEVDTRRKVFHFMMVAMLLPATYVDPTFAALALSLMLAIFLLLDLFRASQLPPLSKSLAYFLTPYVDGRDLKGPVVISHIFLLIGCAIPLWLSLGTLPRAGTAYLSGWGVLTREVSMVSGVICVGLGDAAASLVGRRYGRRKWIWGGGKSIEGSIAFATAVGLALGLAKAWLRIGGWPANNADGWIITARKSAVAAGVASLTEAVLTGGNDNVVCPIVLWLCVKALDI